MKKIQGYAESDIATTVSRESPRLADRREGASGAPRAGFSGSLASGGVSLVKTVVAGDGQSHGVAGKEGGNASCSCILPCNTSARSHNPRCQIVYSTRASRSSTTVGDVYCTKARGSSAKRNEPFAVGLRRVNTPSIKPNTIALLLLCRRTCARG